MSTRAPHETVVACFIIAKFTKPLRPDVARYTSYESKSTIVVVKADVEDDLFSLYVLSKDTFFFVRFFAPPDRFHQTEIPYKRKVRYQLIINLKYGFLRAHI